MSLRSTLLLLGTAALLLGPRFAHANDGRICVLNFERKIHPFTKTLDRVFGNNPNVHLVDEAIPLDFLKCIQGDYTEIVVLAHALEMDPSGKRINLGYFQRIKGDARQAAIQQAKTQVDQQIARIEADFQKTGNSTYSCGPSLKPRSNCYALESRLNQAQNEKRMLETLPADYPIYGPPLPVLPRIFELSRDALRKERAVGQAIPLKRIRFISCLPDAVIARYEALGELVRENEIQIDHPPKQELMSWIEGQPVTTLDPTWVAEDGQYESRPNDYFYAYLDLKTELFYRHGETVALRGQYRIRVKGVALGLESKWSTLYIRYADVDGMQVGETRTISALELDASFAFWLNLEIGFAPKPHIQLPSEINSLGASLGLYNWIEIERLY